jgi:hypothetical protein
LISCVQFSRKIGGGLHRKYPDQAAFALSDERVTKTIEKRFEKNGAIQEIRSLQYDFFTGLNRICFELTPVVVNIGYHG